MHRPSKWVPKKPAVTEVSLPASQEWPNHPNQTCQKKQATWGRKTYEHMGMDQYLLIPFLVG